MGFEFRTFIPKSSDKLSSQKTAASTSNAKVRNPSFVSQLKLSNNHPESVKRFTLKKSIFNALEGAAP